MYSQFMMHGQKNIKRICTSHYLITISAIVVSMLNYTVDTSYIFLQDCQTQSNFSANIHHRTRKRMFRITG